MPLEPAVEVDRLHVVRGGREALDRITLDVRSGTVTGLLGPSGSGKSTLMRSIVGTQLVESGAVRVLGEPAGTPALRRRVAYTTQEPAVYGDLTVRENLGYFARLVGAPGGSVDDSIELVGLGDEADRVVDRLSGGQRSRVSLATALVGRPELLVLDEATASVDPEAEALIEDGLTALMTGRTSLVIAHRLSTIRRADRIIVMHAGLVVEEGSHEQLIAHGGRYAKLWQLQTAAA